MSRFKGVIFDMDGTLLDTESIYIDSGRATLTALGLEVNDALFHETIGASGAEVQTLFEETYGNALHWPTFDAKWMDFHRELSSGGIPLKSGVIELLDTLDAANLPFALATNSSTESARRNLGFAGLDGRFPDSKVFTRNMVARPKPAPDLFHAAAQSMGLRAENCVVFEDSEPGVQAALAAGATVVQVPDILPPRTRDAHLIATDLLTGARSISLIF